MSNALRSHHGSRVQTFGTQVLGATYGQMSHEDVYIFVATTFAVQFASLSCFVRLTILIWYELK